MRFQAIASDGVDFKLVGICGILLRTIWTIFQRVPKLLLCNLSAKITFYIPCYISQESMSQTVLREQIIYDIIVTYKLFMYLSHVKNITIAAIMYILNLKATFTKQTSTYTFWDARTA